YAAAWVVMLRSGEGPLFDRRLFASQLLYALPFGAAMLVAIPQQYAHQYVVSASVSPELFAIYAVGCFQVPVVALLYSHTFEVLFGARFAAAAPLFRVSVAGVALAIMPMDGVLRARNQTRWLFCAYLAKAVVTVPLVWFGMRRFGMMGAIGSWALAEVFGKAMLLAR